MARPARGRVRRQISRLDFQKLAVDHLHPVTAAGRRGGKAMHLHPRRKPAQKQPAQGRQQKQKPKRIGEKAGQEQKHAGQHLQRAVAQRRLGPAQPVKRGAQLRLRLQPLAAQNREPQRSTGQHQRKACPKPQPAAQLDEQPDLDQRPGKKCQQKPHIHLRFITPPGLVDLIAPLPYISGGKQNTNRAGNLMGNAIIQLIVLAAVAIFLVLRLKNVLGTRDGYEEPILPREGGLRERPTLEVIEGGPDRDIVDHVPEGSDAAVALAQMKRVEPSFGVASFLQGSRAAYEMILMAFEKGDLAPVKPFLAPEVYQAFEEAVAARKARGLQVQAEFLGLRELVLSDASFDVQSREAELTVRFGGELISVARDSAGTIVEGDPKAPRKQRDSWTFARVMGSADPNWQLVATGG